MEQKTATEPAEHFGQTLGFEHLPAAPSTAVLELRIQRRHCNRHGSVHGGVLMSILDTAGMWANTPSGEIAGGATVSISCNFLKGVHMDKYQSIRATAQVTRKGSRLYFANVEVHALPGEELAATAQAVYALPVPRS